jgi:hypothetical protein
MWGKIYTLSHFDLSSYSIALYSNFDLNNALWLWILSTVLLCPVIILRWEHWFPAGIVYNTRALWFYGCMLYAVIVITICKCVENFMSITISTFQHRTQYLTVYPTQYCMCVMHTVQYNNTRGHLPSIERHTCYICLHCTVPSIYTCLPEHQFIFVRFVSRKGKHNNQPRGCE